MPPLSLLFRCARVAGRSGVAMRRHSRLVSGGPPPQHESPKRVVFLGTPQVAADVLDQIVQASATDRSFEIVGIVTKPPMPAGRGNRLTSSPVQLYGERAGIPVLTPNKATEEAFLEEMTAIQPDLCITASYGNYLPKKFLSIPRFGTLNIHPSLLPRWRGAAPVQRSLENGDTDVGVTVLFTVQKMDAGPVVAQSRLRLTGDEPCPEVLAALMRQGAADLVAALPSVWAGTEQRREQDESAVTEAAKFDNADSRIDFASMTARTIHNRCRALCGTFGTWCTLASVEEKDSDAAVENSLLLVKGDVTRVNLITTIVLSEANPLVPAFDGSNRHVGRVRHPDPSVKADILSITCGDGSVLGVTAIQPATKRVMQARDFLNGLKKNRRLYWVDLPPS